MRTPGLLAHAGAADESLAIAMVFAALWIGWIGWSRVRGSGFVRVPRAAGFALFGTGIVLLVAAAIVPQALFGPTPTSTTPEPSAAANSGSRPTSTATLEFVTPADGEVVADDALEVVMDLEGGRVVEGASTQLAPDEGHVHLAVDGDVISMTYGTVQVIDLRTVAPGEHTLVAEFVAADHAPFAPRVATSVSFTTGDDA